MIFIRSGSQERKSCFIENDYRDEATLSAIPRLGQPRFDGDLKKIDPFIVDRNKNQDDTDKTRPHPFGAISC